MLPMTGCSQVGLLKSTLLHPIIRLATGFIRYIKPQL
ncbi:hypothetical protein Goshw_021670, partial [Gossypium schwendimanii]|nr:hypothetical protein [Gossypium schwendimanii]